MVLQGSSTDYLPGGYLQYMSEGTPEVDDIVNDRSNMVKTNNRSWNLPLTVLASYPIVSRPIAWPLQYLASSSQHQIPTNEDLIHYFPLPV